jgi:hypothetical protein
MNFNISKGLQALVEGAGGRYATEKREAGVWFCSNCAKFHIKVGELLLTFDKEEFANFSNSVFDCLSSAITIDDIRDGTPVIEGGSDAIGTSVVWHSR